MLRILVIGVAALLTLPLMTACSSAPSEGAIEGEDGVLIEASAASRSELGVTSWRMSTTPNGNTTTVRGVDGGGKTVADLTMAWRAIENDTDNGYRTASRLDYAGRRSTVVLSVTGKPGHRSVRIESDFAEAPASARRCVELAVSDVKGSPSAGVAVSAGGSLVPQSMKISIGLRPMEPGPALVRECDSLLLCAKQGAQCGLTSAGTVGKCSVGTLVDFGGGVLNWLEGDDTSLADTVKDPLDKCTTQIAETLKRCDDIAARCGDLDFERACTYGSDGKEETGTGAVPEVNVDDCHISCNRLSDPAHRARCNDLCE